MLDQAVELAHWLPAWCDPTTGMPRSWRHYMHGVASLERLKARESLRMFGASSASWAKKEDAEKWLDEQRDYAGFL